MCAAAGGEGRGKRREKEGEGAPHASAAQPRGDGGQAEHRRDAGAGGAGRVRRPQREGRGAGQGEGCRGREGGPAALTGCASPQVHSTDFPGNYPGYDDAWDQRRFEEVGRGRRGAGPGVFVGSLW